MTDTVDSAESGVDTAGDRGCRLFLGNLPKSKTDRDIFDEVSRTTPGRLVRVITYKNFEDPSLHRGFCFLDYGSAAAAAAARILLSRRKVFGCKTIVDWADPEPAVDARTMAAVRILFVTQYGGVLDDRALARVFGRYGPVERVKNLKNYAFVHFGRREHAQAAMDALHGSWDEATGVRIDVSWAKPPADKQTRERTLRDRENRVRRSGIAAVVAAPPVSAATGPAAPYDEYDHYGYDFGPRQPCGQCSSSSDAATVAATTTTVAATTTADEGTSSSSSSSGESGGSSPRGRGRYDNKGADDERRAVSHGRGDWTTNIARTTDEKLLNFFHRISASCDKHD